MQSLAARSQAPVDVEASLSGRPAPVLETAAYFVVAEALTNAAKHAPHAPVRVQIDMDEERLAITVADEGPGGAQPTGSGLTGMSMGRWRNYRRYLEPLLERLQPYCQE